MNKILWHALNACILLLWAGVLIFGIEWWPKKPLVTIIVIGGLLFLHLTNLPLAIFIGREKGLSYSRIILKTIVFGFTWWFPLKNGVFEK